MQEIQKTNRINDYNHDIKPVAEPETKKTVVNANAEGSNKAAYRKFVAENKLQVNAAFDERKFLADRCRLIKGHAFEAGGGGFGNGQIHMAIMGIENYLMSVHSPLAMQMLGDLQQAGYNGFKAWCAKYGV